MALGLKAHGRLTTFKLDNLAAAVTDVSAYFETLKRNGKRDRPRTETFTDSNERHQVLGLKMNDFALTGYWEPAAVSKAHGRLGKLLLGGYLISPALNKGKITRKCALTPTTTFQGAATTDVTYDVPGLLSSDFTASGYYDGTPAGIDSVLLPVVDWDPGVNATPYILTVGFQGYPIGNLVEMMQLADTDYNIDGAISKTVDFTITGQSDDQADLGYSYHDLVQETGAAPLSFTSVNELASSSLGGVAHLHVTQFSGATATVILQHSTDNATWSTLATFAAVTAPNVFQRVVVPVGTTINQYVRAQISSATYASMTFQVSFARRGWASSQVTAGTHKHLVALIQNQINVAAQAAWLWEYDPQGTAVSNPKYTGACRAESYGVTFDIAQPLKVDIALKVSGAVVQGSN